jgi:hypothetical protein
MLKVVIFRAGCKGRKGISAYLVFMSYFFIFSAHFLVITIEKIIKGGT